MNLAALSMGDWLMALAILFFWLSALVKGFHEQQGWLALALFLVGGANAILMTLSNSKPELAVPQTEVRVGEAEGQ